MFAQRGAGSTGGGLAGGGGLSGGGGRATGLDVNDDLKGFHATLAMQASTQQTAAYAAMIKSTETVSAQLQAFLDQPANPASDLAPKAVALDQAIEKARAENRKFIESFSEPQKSGLREITKRLTKDDTDLAEQAREFSRRVDAPDFATVARSLSHALSTFHNRQIELGEEMSISAGGGEDASTFSLGPVKNAINFNSQRVSTATSGVITRSKPADGKNVFTFELVSDLSDLQQNIVEVLRTQLDKADRCGERVEVQSAALMPQPPASQVVVKLHYEHWACLGREPNEIAEGEGTVELKLILSVSDNGSLRLVVQIGRIDAQGLIADLLRSGSLGDDLRAKVADTVLTTLSRGEDLAIILPGAAQGYATIHSVRFQGTGMGRLTAVIDGDIRLSDDKASSFISDLKGRSSQEAGPQPVAR